MIDHDGALHNIISTENENISTCNVRAMSDGGSWHRLPEKIGDELLQCGVCYNRYSRTGCIPKLLPCSHGFCVECIEACIRARRHFRCPICRHETRIVQGATALPNNYTVLSLLDIIENCAQEERRRPPPFNPHHNEDRGQPPVPPPRRVFGLTPSLFLLQRYGSYSADKLKTSHFRQPKVVAVCPDGKLVAVVDSPHMSIQLFSQAGYVAMFSVLGAQCVCFLTTDRLLVGTHRGILLFTTRGEQINKDTTIGSIVAMTAYRFGFIAASTTVIYSYRASLKRFRTIKCCRHRNIFKKNIFFRRISAIAVTTHTEIVVLDAGAGKIYLLDDDGLIRLIISPDAQPCGPLLNPEGLAVDKCNAIFVSDTDNHRVLKFSADGYFSRCVLNLAVRHQQTPKCQPFGIAASHHKLVVVVTGTQFAEVQLYKL